MPLGVALGEAPGDWEGRVVGLVEGVAAGVPDDDGATRGAELGAADGRGAMLAPSTGSGTMTTGMMAEAVKPLDPTRVIFSSMSQLMDTPASDVMLICVAPAVGFGQPGIVSGEYTALAGEPSSS